MSAKLLELLTLNHSLSERRIIFFLGWSSPMSLQLSWIMPSSLAPFPSCQHSCGIVPNGPASLSIKVAVIYRGKMQQLFGCIPIDVYVIPALFAPGPKVFCWISSKMPTFSSWDLWNAQLIFFWLCSFCVVTYLTLSFKIYMCTSIHTKFWCGYSPQQYLFQSHSNLF